MDSNTYKQVSGGQWNAQLWPNFSRAEMACRHCNAFYLWPEFMDRLQYARTSAGKAFHVHSAHRCSLHNARVGGAPLSQHLTLAADIGLHGHTPRRLYQHCRAAGFTGFGFYSQFLHIDLGPKRAWYGSKKAKQLWQIY